MQPTVLCIIPDAMLNKMLANVLDEAQVYGVTSLAEGEQLLVSFGSRATAVVVDAFENRDGRLLQASSLDFIRRARGMTRARFFGHSAFVEVRESMVADDLCHEAHDILELTQSLEIYLLPQPGHGGRP